MVTVTYLAKLKVKNQMAVGTAPREFHPCKYFFQPYS